MDEAAQANCVRSFRRGGIRQRALQMQEADTGVVPLISRSKLATALLQRWAWGELSAVGLQALAAAATADGLEHNDIVRLAALGSGGRHKGNCHRELHV